jgi:hypothetical protein
LVRTGAVTGSFRTSNAFAEACSSIGPVAGLVGIEGGVVSGVINLESPSV